MEKKLGRRRTTTHTIPGQNLANCVCHMPHNAYISTVLAMVDAGYFVKIRLFPQNTGIVIEAFILTRPMTITMTNRYHIFFLSFNVYSVNWF